MAVLILVAVDLTGCAGALPVLWLYGPPGVGKTTVAWEFFVRLTRGGVSTGYVDIDQLGMCYGPPTAGDWAPEPASDPGRHRLKARNLDAVVANFRDAGARCAVVSGVVDAGRGFDAGLGPHAGLVPHAALTLCRLRCEPAELRRRLASRGRPGDGGEDVARYAAALDRNGLPGVCIDTTGRDIADVLRLVRERTGWPDLAGLAPHENASAFPPGPSPGRSVVAEPPGRSVVAEPPGRSVVAEPPGPFVVAERSAWSVVAERSDLDGGAGEILWLCGPTAVGKSTVGWQVYEAVRRAGVRAAFVDLEQIGFCRPVPDGDPGNHRLKAANLAAVWRTYRATGARRLIVVGSVDRPDEVRRYTAALPAATLTLCRLHAGRDQLSERITRRGQGLVAAWGLPGDELRGQPAALLRRAADRAAADAEALEIAALGDLRVATDGRSVQDVAEEILRRTWQMDGARSD